DPLGDPERRDTGNDVAQEPGTGRRIGCEVRVGLRLATLRERRRPDLLDRDPQLVTEHDRIGQVPTVEREEVGDGERIGIRRAHVEWRARVRSGVRTHAPRAADVVLEAGAAYRRQLAVAVAVDLHLALAVPHTSVDRPDADCAAEEPPGPA